MKRSINKLFLIALIISLICILTACGSDNNDIDLAKNDTFTFKSDAGFSVILPHVYKENVYIEEYNYGDTLGIEFYLKELYEQDYMGFMFSIYKSSVEGIEYVIDEFGEQSILGTTEDGLYYYGIQEPFDLQFDQEHQAEYENMKAYMGDIIDSFSADDFIPEAIPSYVAVEDNNDYLDFEAKKDAWQRFSNMNWKNFYQYPEDYNDGQYYYLVGRVISTNSDGSGLLRLVDGDDRTIVQYYSGGSARLYENEIVVVYGTISGGGSFIYSDTGVTNACPLIFVYEYQDCITDISALTKAESEFIYGEYINIDGYFRDFPGESFTFTEHEFDGYPYTLQSMKYSCGNALISYYDYCANKMNISVVINVDKDGTDIPIHLIFGLTGDVSCINQDRGNTGEEYVRK